MCAAAAAGAAADVVCARLGAKVPRNEMGGNGIASEIPGVDCGNILSFFRDIIDFQVSINCTLVVPQQFRHGFGFIEW